MTDAVDNDHSAITETDFALNLVFPIHSSSPVISKLGPDIPYQTPRCQDSTICNNYRQRLWVHHHVWAPFCSLPEALCQDRVGHRQHFTAHLGHLLHRRRPADAAGMVCSRTYRWFSCLTLRGGAFQEGRANRSKSTEERRLSKKAGSVSLLQYLSCFHAVLCRETQVSQLFKLQRCNLTNNCTEVKFDSRLLTCSSVQDLGLKEYAGVLVSDAGEEQSLRLHRTTRYYHLKGTSNTMPTIKHCHAGHKFTIFKLVHI